MSFSFANHAQTQATFEIFPVNKHIYLSAQPLKTSESWFLEHKIKTVINLRTQSETQPDLSRQYLKFGIDYHLIPISLDHLNMNTISQFNQILNKPVVIHCTSANRAALMYVLPTISAKDATGFIVKTG